MADKANSRVARIGRHLVAGNEATATPAAVEEDPWDTPATNFFTGKFMPVREEADRLPCVIEGVLPTELQGTYFRNGPNPANPPQKGDNYHYFDGDGMILAIEMEGGQALFTQKWVRTERFAHDKKQGKSVYEFGSMAVGEMMNDQILNEDNERMGKANTSVVFHGNKFYALEDADQPYRVALPSLETIGKDQFSGTLDGKVFTAHPKIDQDTGEMIGYGCDYGAPFNCEWKYTIIGADGKAKVNMSIPLRNTSYNHDFACTKNYSIVFDGNLVINWESVFKGGAMWEYNRDIPGRIGVMSRYCTDPEEVRWFDVAPFCVSHTANAFEDPSGEEITIICNNIGFEGFKPTFSEETPADPDANLHQWTINLKTGKVEETALRKTRSDFPSFNQQHTGQPFRYVYSQLLDYEEPHHYPYLHGCYKYDLQTRTYKDQSWGEKGYFFGGEVTFVPRHKGTSTSLGGDSEDDGFLVVLVNNVRARRTEFRVYDAKEFGNPGCAPVCTVICPRRAIPLGTHGIFLRADEVDSAINSA
jgi:carotenoid cleavage dioxygenase-like enzyme